MPKLFDKRKRSTSRRDETARTAEETAMNDSNATGHAVDISGIVSGEDNTPLDQATPTTTSANGSSNSVPSSQINSNVSAHSDEEACKTGMRSGIDNYGAISTPTNSHQYHQADLDENVRNSSQPLLGVHLEMSESSDASSQYSDKMDYLTPEDRRAGNDAERYLAQTMFHRAFPERSLALFVTLLLELPTLFIISGGSDQLCSLIGRRRYQLLVAFLPLTSAISGNVGLQASTLTTRAVSHLHVTKHSYCTWLLAEVGTAGYQGLGMGSVSGIFAYVASGRDFAFGITIFMAQFVSILTAGLTGTLAPLIFTFIFHRDSGQWGGPLETAIQDIVGSFAMVVLSYHVLHWLGPHDIHESDVC
mmetsp:Transcript_34266/g.74345  ORF Transcript_34266/g.74345 Transcript_34266/m.74345 type:complete len:362 (-) Transcript_34266:289-1374(-)